MPIKKGWPKLIYPVYPERMSQLMAKIAKKLANIKILRVPVEVKIGSEANTAPQITHQISDLFN